VGAKHERILGIHVGLVVAEIFCSAGFAFELYRATSGNALSWAYVFEWPIFAGYAIYMWRRLLKEETGKENSAPVAESSEPADKSLERYNEYLRAVHERGDGHAEHPEMRSFNG
jgi:hypothetical protein